MQHRAYSPIAPDLARYEIASIERLMAVLRAYRMARERRRLR